MARRKSSSSRQGRSRRGRRRSGFGTFLRRTFVAGLVVGAIIAVGGAGYYGFKSLAYDLDLVKEIPERTLVYDRSGTLMGHVAGHGENRVSVPASQVSEHFIKALLAREDTRFYKHGGVDYVGVLRAVVTNLKSGGKEQGASTITMQLARNTFGMKEMTLQRKFLEVALAYRLEARYSKDEILTFYMNRVYFGSGLYGVERAAQGYFMKSAAQLSLGESAMLAGVIRGPSLLNPFRSLENAKDIQTEVLDRLVASDVVTKAEADAAKQQPIRLRPAEQRLATGSYPLQFIFDLLEDYLEPHLIETGGLRIYTTLDAGLQKSAEEALDRHLTSIEKRQGYRHATRSSHKAGTSTKYLQGSVVTLDNRTGGIVALVGGRDFGESSFNRAYLARRQVGSTFKPFVYAVAMDRGGLLPGAYVSDNPIQLGNWSPKNSDGTFTGLQPAAIGLIKSRNTMSVRVGLIAGIENLRGLARALKIGEIPNSPVVALGAFESSPVTLTSAYSTFPAGGVNYSPFLITRIEHADGTLLYEHEITARRIFPEGVAWMTTDMLGHVLDDGTATEARAKGYQAPAYGKTGTTNDFVDAWFVGYTDKLTTGVWVGLDQPKTIMDRGYGSTLALPVWTEVMKTAESRGYAAAKIPAPAGTKSLVLCRECGQLSSNGTRYPYQMDLPADLAPRGTCRGHGGVFAQNGAPQAFPVPGETVGATGPAAPGLDPGPPPGEGGLSRAVRGIGRFLFGRSDQ